MKILRGRVNWDKFYSVGPHLELLLDEAQRWEDMASVPAPRIEVCQTVDTKRYARDHYFCNGVLPLSTVAAALPLVSFGEGHESFRWEGTRKIWERQSFRGGTLELVGVPGTGHHVPAVRLPDGRLWTRKTEL